MRTIKIDEEQAAILRLLVDQEIVRIESIEQPVIQESFRTHMATLLVLAVMLERQD